MKNRSFWPVLLAVVVVALVVAVVTRGGALAASQPRYVAEVALADQPSPGDARRIWKEVSWQRLAELGEDKELFGPLHLELGADGHAFVVDYGDTTIKEFSQGKLVRTYGHGKGQGPGEFGVINDLSLGPDGTLWVADHANGRITVFDAHGAVQETLKPELRPYRLAVAGTRDFLVLQPEGADLFARFDPKGELLGTFGRLVEKQETFPLVLDGWIDPAPDGTYVYAAHFAGILGRYDRSGKPLFLVNTIDAKPLPRLVRAARGRTWVDREAEASSWSLSVAGDEIHLLAADRNGLTIDRAIDTYRLSDGKYLYSRPVPEACDEVMVGKDTVFTVTGTTVTEWRSTEG